MNADGEPEKNFAPRLAKKWVGTIVAGGLLVAVIWLLLANRGSTPMPEYQGKTIRYWMGQLHTTNSAQAVLAFSATGELSVPFLTHELERNDSIGEKLHGWIYPKLPSVISRHLRKPVLQSERWSDAALGLERADSRVAIPALTNLLADTNPERQCLVLYTLSCLLRPIDTNCIPAITNCLRSKDIFVCFETVVLLERLKAEKFAIPALANSVTSTNPQMRLCCLEALWQVDPANAGKWRDMLTNDPAWKAGQRLPWQKRVSSGFAPNQPAK